MGCFEGTHAFHNHSTTSLYTKEKNNGRRGNNTVWRRQKRERKAAKAKAEGEEPGAGESHHMDGDGVGLWVPQVAPSSSSWSDDDEEGAEVGGPKESAGEEAEDNQGMFREKEPRLSMTWSEDAEKVIATSHYRHMRSITVSEPLRLTEEGELCVRVCLWGDSFMLHQIRKMVGTAAGVAVGSIPLELCRASLAPPGRIK